MNTLIEQVKTEITYRGYSHSTSKNKLAKIEHSFRDEVTDRGL